MKHLTLCALMALGLQTLGFAQFTLTVQESPASADATLTTYRFYVNMQDATDKMSAVYGDEESNMIINAPAGVFNSEYNSSWNASASTLRSCLCSQSSQTTRMRPFDWTVRSVVRA